MRRLLRQSAGKSFAGVLCGKIWNPVLYTHISGRATVAVWESGSGAVYCCDMPFTINYQENFMEV